MKRAMLVCTLLVMGAMLVRAQTKKSPADGYTVHVTAKQLVNGHEMGPFHHYCNVVTNDPFIICQIYDSDDPNGTMSQVEFIVAKKLTRPAVALTEWNTNWHDHAVEIGSGNVKVLDVDSPTAKQIADLVATTDGIIYSFEFDKSGKIPTGRVFHAQAVGHEPLTATEYKKNSEQE